ncbi:uncharacterized protein PO1_contig-015-2 [Mycobacterium sp. PO1]|nr:uncharacterized protein PO1_contig-015-2 [Mycobacterium sp. PO1]GFM26160.1 uncharacterized protein PO2_contig-086-4 [Mycobacterium sp. PO2]
MTGLIEFRDDGAGYLAWLAAHPEGYVINIARSHNATHARVHHASCRTISGQIPVGSAWTGPYVKVCAEDLAELEQWAIEILGQPISPCGTCRPASGGGQPTSTKQTERAAGPRAYPSGGDKPAAGEPAPIRDDGGSPKTVPFSADPLTVAVPMPEGRCFIHGPATDSPVVEAWADDYIRFERRPSWQEHLRSEIRSRCGQLVPSAGQVLHATFFGPKLPNADVENLALYYIDSFKTAGRNGIRFEYGAVAPPTPDGAERSFCYRYELVPRSGSFTHWQEGRTLASFDWTDLGDFVGEKKLAQVWLALAQSQVELAEPACAPETPFAVRVQVRPPHGRQPVLGNLVKGIFDGVISAFQAHADTTVLPEVVARIATVLPADPAEIEKHLLDQRRAVLGVLPRLVSPYRESVKWDPADHWCVAGELLAADQVGPHWAIKGELIEVTR